MNAIESLFFLVESLTKSEKRYFRMLTGMQGGEKKYLTLFNLLEQHSVFDDSLKRKLSELFPGHSLEPPRKHLFRVLIKSLRQFENENSVDSQLMNLIEDSRILFNKGIISLSVEQLAKAKEIALVHEKYLHYVLAARQEMEYLSASQFFGITEIELVDKQERIKEFLEHETNASRHGALYEVLLFRYWKKGTSRNERDVLKLNDLILEEHQLLTLQRIKTFESQKLHLHFQSTYFLMSNSAESSLHVFRDLDALYQSQQHLWKDSPAQYVQLIDGILYNLRITSNYNEMDFYFHRLNTIRSESENLKINIKYKTYEHRLNALADQRKIEEAMDVLKEITPIFAKEITSLTQLARSQFHFAIARILFLAKQYQQALKYINAILNLSEASTQARLYISCRILYLQINSFLNSAEHLIYVIRSIERKFGAERKMFGAENLVISFLKNWISGKTMKNFSEQIETLKANPFELGLLKELFIEDWVADLNKKK
jgi:tetratricopeptide (TPR) repeat protein